MFQTAFQPTAFQNDAFQIVITPPTPTGPTGGDGWTKEEWKHYQELDRKKRKAEEKRIAALKADAENRKKTIADLVDPKPVAKKQRNKVQSNQEVSEDIPSEITKLDRDIANLIKQQEELLQGVMLRKELVRIQTEMALLEARRLQEEDDEQAILLLI